jgi:hypothetical protein
MAELEYQRDIRFPATMQWLYRQEVLLTAYSARSEENARRAKKDLFSVQNSRKAREAGLAGLLDPVLMAGKKSAEEKLRQTLAQNPQLAPTGSAFQKIEEAQKIIAQSAKVYNLIESGQAFNSHLFTIARTITRSLDERSKPNGDRLREFRDSNKESLEFQLFSEEPLYNDFEILKLTDSLTFMLTQLGADHPLCQKVLAGQSPAKRATALILGSKLKDTAFRKALYKGSADELKKAGDPLVELVLSIDSEARALRKIMETQDEAKRQAYGQIAKAKFELEKNSSYPDATFTLRLAYGTCTGYEENGQHVPFQTTFAGLYERSAEHHNRPPFDIPDRWMKQKDKLNLATPYNFVCTADIIGGNSGSPVVNRKGEFVGIIFDGNIQSLVLNFIFSQEQARAVSVNCQAIIEALNKVYDASEIANELLGKK